VCRACSIERWHTSRIPLLMNDVHEGLGPAPPAVGKLNPVSLCKPTPLCHLAGIMEAYGACRSCEDAKGRLLGLFRAKSSYILYLLHSIPSPLHSIPSLTSGLLPYGFDQNLSVWRASRNPALLHLWGARHWREHCSLRPSSQFPLGVVQIGMTSETVELRKRPVAAPTTPQVRHSLTPLRRACGCAPVAIPDSCTTQHAHRV
jgi:hypothetical protein